MSGFVPFRRSARFQARLSENADQAEREAVPDRPVADGAEQVEIEEGVQEVQAQPQEDVQALVATKRKLLLRSCGLAWRQSEPRWCV